MKEETIEQVRKRCDDLQRRYDIASKERELERRAVDVLIAAGLLERSKFEQAQDLVRSLAIKA